MIKEKPMEKMEYYIVLSQGGDLILGVFGSALLSEAQECARRVERTTGFPAFVERIQTLQRPRVGDVFRGVEP